MTRVNAINNVDGVYHGITLERFYFMLNYVLVVLPWDPLLSKARSILLLHRSMLRFYRVG